MHEEEEGEGGEGKGVAEVGAEEGVVVVREAEEGEAEEAGVGPGEEGWVG